MENIRREDVSNVMRQLNQKPIVYYPIYTEIAGSVTGGVLLSQLMYWFSASGKDKIYKKDEDFRYELNLTNHEMKGAKTKIKYLNFLIITREGIPAKTYYEIDWDLYFQAISEASKNRKKQVRRNPTNKKEVNKSQLDEIRQTASTKSDKHNIENNTESNNIYNNSSTKNTHPDGSVSLGEKDRDNVAKKKLPKIVRNPVPSNSASSCSSNKSVRTPTKRTSRSCSSNNSVPKGKYAPYTAQDEMRYNTLVGLGCTNHRNGTQAYFDTMDALHALFSPNNCPLPIKCHVPEEYIDYEWSIDEFVEVYNFHKNHHKDNGHVLIKNIGNFIYTKKINGNNAWSPLIEWHKKMNRGSTNTLTEDGNKLYKSMQSAKIIGLDDLPSNIINNVAKDISDVYNSYVLVENNNHKSDTYKNGLFSIIAKFIKEKMNKNYEYELFWINKTGFVDLFIKEMVKRNVIKKNTKSTAKTGDIIERNGKKYIKVENGGYRQQIE